MEGFARASCVGGPRAGVEHWRRAAPHHPLPLRPCSKTLDGHKKGGAASSAPRGKCTRVFPPPRAPGRGPPHRPRMQRRRRDLAWLGSGVGKAGAGRPRRARARARPCSTPGLSTHRIKRVKFRGLSLPFFLFIIKGAAAGEAPPTSRARYFLQTLPHSQVTPHAHRGRAHPPPPPTHRTEGGRGSVCQSKKKENTRARTACCPPFVPPLPRARAHARPREGRADVAGRGERGRFSFFLLLFAHQGKKREGGRGWEGGRGPRTAPHTPGSPKGGPPRQEARQGLPRRAGVCVAVVVLRAPLSPPLTPRRGGGAHAPHLSKNFNPPLSTFFCFVCCWCLPPC
jgi:hypothetical protein